jgi:hypothetical protein
MHKKIHSRDRDQINGDLQPTAQPNHANPHSSTPILG